MSKSIVEKSKEWQCSASTIRRFCQSGIIPPAEKQSSNGRWQIPDDWPKPPMTRHALCFLLDSIYQLKSGVDFNDIRFGYSNEEIKQGYNYLIWAAFMSSINTDNLSKELAHSNVTPRGEALIKREIDEGKSHYSSSAYLDAKLNLGVATLTIGGKVNN